MDAWTSGEIIVALIGILATVCLGAVGWLFSTKADHSSLEELCKRVDEKASKDALGALNARLDSQDERLKEIREDVRDTRRAVTRFLADDKD